MVQQLTTKKPADAQKQDPSSLQKPVPLKSNYNAKLKIWSGAPMQHRFGKDLSIGELIFKEMERNPELIAQVRKKPTR